MSISGVSLFCVFLCVFIVLLFFISVFVILLICPAVNDHGLSSVGCYRSTNSYMSL